MPLPFSEVFRSGGHLVLDASTKRLVSLQVAVFNWLALGKPKSAPSYLRLGASLSARQWSVVRMLQHLVVDGTTPQFVDAAGMGRASVKFEGYEAYLEVLSRAVETVHVFEHSYAGARLRERKGECHDSGTSRCGAQSGEVAGRSDCPSKPLIAERLSFPANPSFDPRGFFDENTKALYERPLDLMRSLDEVGKPPKVQVRASPENKILVFKKLADAGLLKPVADGTFLEGYKNGLFAVPKDGSRDRMVLDGRPANMVDQGQQRWSQAMASASALAQLYIDDDKVLVTSGEDLKDCFYQFKVNAQRTARNVLEGFLTLEEARRVFGKDFAWEGDRVYVGLSSLAMGDCCAVEFAQCAHVGLMLQNQVAAIDELITLKGSIPRGLLQVGVIVDDLVVLEQVMRVPFENGSLTHGDWQSPARMMKAQAAYNAVGLQNNPKKAFIGETCSNFWGIDIDGDKGLLRASQKRMWPAMMITLRVCSLGLCTVGLLEALAGTWVSLLGVRRRLYCLMDVLFEPLSMDCSATTVIRMSDALTSELMSIAVMAPLAVVNLRAKFGNFVAATDASSTVIAGVRAAVEPAVAAEVARHTLRRGIWTKLLPPGRALLRAHGLLDPEDEVPDQKYRSHPLWEVMARALTFRECWRRRIHKPQHINVSELQSFLLEERRIANSSPSTRYLAGADSQVALGAVVKGRASSPKLNGVLQASLPYAIGGDVYSLPMYFNTASNRADAPTRESTPPGPDMDIPAWFGDLIDGSYDSFDEWMHTVGAPSGEVQLPFEDICGSQDLGLRPGTAEKREAWRAKQSSDADGGDRRPARSLPHSGDQQATGVPVQPSARPSNRRKSLSDEAVELLKSFPQQQFSSEMVCMVSLKLEHSTFTLVAMGLQSS